MTKKGQGMVELLLVMVILLPLASYVVKYTKDTFLPKFSGWFAWELQSQVRYARSMSDPDFKVSNKGALANIKGDVPLKYSRSLMNGHPLLRVQRGW